MDAAMAAAVSALKAQNTGLATISNNLANSQTTGYKAVQTQYLSQLTETTAGTNLASGGVRAISVQNLGDQGLIANTTTTTNLAIDGEGLFAVQYGLNDETNSYSEVYYTRNGAFKPDDAGNLKLNGTSYYLLGWPTDVNGEILSANVDNVASLEVINIDKFNSSAVASSNYTFQANLPAEAEVGDSFNTSMQVYDSLGVAQVFPVSWEKTGTNTWSMTVGTPTNPAGTAPSGDLRGQNGSIVTEYEYEIVFNSDGTLASVTAQGNAPTTPTLKASFDDGAYDSSVAIHLGTVGSTDGLSQYSTGQSTPAIGIKYNDGDGVQYGELTGVSVDEDGYVVAAYSNGNKTTIYKIPVVTFSNEDGLAAKSNGVYEQTTTSGNYILNGSGTNSAGVVKGAALEGSNVDTATEFSNMIVCQQAYSAASQVIGTDRQMFQSLLQQMQ